jgi:hypothetical protein
MNKILIIGSNFGYNTYYSLIKRQVINCEVHIFSKNINEKKINKKIIKILHLNKINFQQYKIIIFATKPKVQSLILRKILLLKRIKAKLIIEKPISHNPSDSLILLKKLKRKKIIFIQNFIYPKLAYWKYLLKFSKKEKIINCDYTWKFRQDFFKNKKNTWKIDKKQGGGLIMYYLPHLFFNLLTIFNDLNNIKVLSKKYKSGHLTDLKFIAYSKNCKILIDVSNNSKINKHSITLNSHDKKIVLINSTKHWTENFELLNNFKLLKKKNESRLSLTSKNMIELNKIKLCYRNYCEQYDRYVKVYKNLGKIYSLNLIN